VAGAVVGLIAAMLTDSYFLVAVGAALGIAFALFKGRKAPDYCSGPGCRSRLAAEDQTCKRCGGIVRGRIGRFADHLDAEEDLG
jgi:hypothetical protein